MRFPSVPGIDKSFSYPTKDTLHHDLVVTSSLSAQITGGRIACTWYSFMNELTQSLEIGCK
ncbi:uncharacterized protein PHALS_00332 [Plasmopara halstedii]|uniref:Uncharacterized protein n=1 Tax=Plasmopara halstedii TaxID=4781 RepID=A0A0P1A770_PLAHL|nr:uncharacterized protein PHALS_00332 [Plasmopara halstedii]CEG36010.1 hypothetical protein PHALS_00332 [Plasmopara halstedii]|eukprot:XP_024572379.1 hypothetical protein PHALS_00332 [Plasmopara halstedii]